MDTALTLLHKATPFFASADFFSSVICMSITIDIGIYDIEYDKCKLSFFDKLYFTKDQKIFHNCHCREFNKFSKLQF